MKIGARAISPHIESYSGEDKPSKKKKRVVSPYFRNTKTKKSRADADGDVSSRQRVVSPYFQQKKKKSRADSGREVSFRQRVVSPYFLKVSGEKPSVSVAYADSVVCENDTGKRKEKRGRGEERENSMLIVDSDKERKSVYFDKVTGCWGCKNHRRNVKFRIGNPNLTSSNDCTEDGVGDVKRIDVGQEEKKQFTDSPSNYQYRNLDYLCSRLAYMRTVSTNEGNLSQVNGAELKFYKELKFYNVGRDKLVNETRAEVDVSSCCKVLNGAEKEQEVAIVTPEKEEETDVKRNNVKQIQARKVSPYFQSSTKRQGEQCDCKEAKLCAKISRCSMMSGVSSNINGSNITNQCTEEKLRDDQVLGGNKKAPRVRKTPLKSPILSSSQKRDVAYARKGAENTWRPPRSNIDLLQEDHWHDPWRVMVICMLLNRTQGTQTRRVISELFTLCSDAKMATEVEAEQIEKIIQTLGLQKKRAAMIQRFSKEYLEEGWTHVTQLHGIGKYAADAYAIFCTGMWERVKPVDHKLTEYWNFLCQTHNHTK